jgi:hypothetical protein
MPLWRVSGLRSQELELRSTLKKAPEGEKAGGAQSGRQLNREALTRDLGTGKPSHPSPRANNQDRDFFCGSPRRLRRSEMCAAW